MQVTRCDVCEKDINPAKFRAFRVDRRLTDLCIISERNSFDICGPACLSALGEDEARKTVGGLA